MTDRGRALGRVSAENLSLAQSRISDADIAKEIAEMQRWQGLGLYRQLFATCPAHLRVGIAPLDVILDERSVLQPDLFVVHRDRVEQRGIRGRPELAVEVLSPGTEHLDRTVKLARYERSGTPSYWLADPVEPSLTAFELRGQGDARRYEQVAHVIGDESWTARLPYGVTITPARWPDSRIRRRTLTARVARPAT